MTRREAEKLGWTFHEGRKPQLVPFGDTYRVQRGYLGAEKTMQRPVTQFAYTRTVSVESYDADSGWQDMTKRLLREIAKIEEQAAKAEQQALKSAEEAA